MSIFRKGLGLLSLKGLNAGLGFCLALGIAMILGSNRETDALLISMFIPITIGNELISFLVLLLVPVLVKEDTKEKTGIWPSGLGLPLLAGTIVLCLLMGMAAHPLVRIMGPGLDGESVQRAAMLFRLQLPTFFLAVMFGVGHAWLNANRRFFAPEIGRLCWRLTALAGLIICGRYWGANGYAASLLVASTIRFLTVFPGPLAQRKFWHWRGLGNLKSTLNRSVATVVVFMGFDWAMYLIVRAMASMDGEGSLTLLDYASRLALVVPILLARSVFTILLPEIAASHKNGGTGTDLTQPIALIFLMTGLPLTALLYWFAPFISHKLCLFSYIDMSSQKSLQMALQGFAFGIPAALAHINLKGLFLAKQDVWSAVKVSVVQTLGLLLTLFVFRSWGLWGITLAVSLSTWLALLCLWWMLEVNWRPVQVILMTGGVVVLLAGFGSPAPLHPAHNWSQPLLTLALYLSIIIPLCRTWNRDLLQAYRRLL